MATLMTKSSPECRGTQFKLCFKWALVTCWFVYLFLINLQLIPLFSLSQGVSGIAAVLKIRKSGSTNPLHNVRIWGFEETFLKADDRLSFPNKIFFTPTVTTEQGGGLLISIPTNMSGRVIFENSQDPHLEMLAIEIRSHIFTFTIVNIYAPHGFDINQVQKFFSNLKTATFIFGDCNLHYPFWGGKTSTPKKRRIFGLVESVAFFYPEYFNAHSHHL
ncbi:hypothetical protein CEXT_477851 [Caerostris extrusa]|uniref:Endonuclease/exonuclease/phosphatase domain-containing protein n=1 Tax=Caerostris extrusa TaxID=172846 RepID=A0AAV4SCU4_CAEEX|nr:hypothetical protein CEXT_477851 [Caerostris extrusa]